MENKVTAYHLMNILESSVAKVRENIEHQYIDNIKSYFKEDKIPKSVNIEINSKTISVPEMCIANLQPINVKSVNIDFDCCIEGIENNEFMLDLSKSDAKNKISINIVLNSENVPEAVIRINDMLISEYIP